MDEIPFVHHILRPDQVEEFILAHEWLHRVFAIRRVIDVLHDIRRSNAHG